MDNGSGDDLSKSSSHSKTKSKFYKLSPNIGKTSAEIIREARAAIRSVDTARPFTPRDGRRQLFGNSQRISRPPSAISLEGLHYIESTDVKLKGSISSGSVSNLHKTHSGTKTLQAKSENTQKSDSDHFLATSGFDKLPILPVDRSNSHFHTSHSSSTDTEGKVKIKEPLFPMPPLNTGSNLHGFKLQTSNSISSSAERKKSLLMNSAHNDQITKLVDGLLERDEDKFYKDEVLPLFDKFYEPAQGGDAKQDLCGVCIELYGILEGKQLLYRSFKYRSTILKVLYKQLETEDNRLQIHLIRIILSLRVTGSNLCCVSKLIFKLSKNDDNDKIFMEENFLEIFLRAIETMDPLIDTEALVYSIGSLKFLTMNKTLLKHISSLGCINVLSSQVLAINEEKQTQSSQKIPEQLGHAMFQVTGCLRNLAENATNRSMFVSSGCILQLLDSLDLFVDDVDVIMNVSSILSKLTMYSDVCSVVSSNVSSFVTQVRLLRKYSHREDLVVRLCFVLGNLTAKNNAARTHLYAQPKCLETLLSILQDYVKPDAKQSKKNAEDVVIKVIRVIANMSIYPNIGHSIAAKNNCLEILQTVLSTHEVNSSEEVIVSTLTTLNNLTFYCVNEGDDSETSKLLALTENILNLLSNNKSVDIVLEGVRVLGNLSRFPVIRECLVKHDMVEITVSYLDSPSLELVFSAVGVIVNLMADKSSRPLLQRNDGIDKLLQVLPKMGMYDWQLAGLVCQAISNFTAGKDATETLGHKQTIELVKILEEYLDKSTALEVCYSLGRDEANREFLHDTWEREFCPVASSLLERLDFSIAVGDTGR